MGMDCISQLIIAQSQPHKISKDQIFRTSHAMGMAKSLLEIAKH
jgi:hypothetical protein